MTTLKREVKSWFLPGMVALMAVAIAVEFMLLIPLLREQGQQAMQGERARKRQQAVYPVSLKIYVDAERRGVISRRELECFRFSRSCPKP